MPEISPEDVVFVQWPTIAIENSAREIERLTSILQRLIDTFQGVDLDGLDYARMILLEEAAAGPGALQDCADEVMAARRSIESALDILGELEPEPEGEGDGD